MTLLRNGLYARQYCAHLLCYMHDIVCTMNTICTMRCSCNPAMLLGWMDGWMGRQTDRQCRLNSQSTRYRVDCGHCHYQLSCILDTFAHEYARYRAYKVCPLLGQHCRLVADDLHNERYHSFCTSPTTPGSQVVWCDPGEKNGPGR